MMNKYEMLELFPQNKCRQSIEEWRNQRLVDIGRMNHTIKKMYARQNKNIIG